jgi:integrase
MKIAHAKLTPAQRAAKLSYAMKTALPAPGRYSAGNNLYLNVTNTGAKSWVFLWLPAGAKWQRELGLGSFTGAGSTFAVTLTEARALADDARRQVKLAKMFPGAALDPIALKEKAVADGTTFRTLMDDYITNVVSGRSKTERARKHNINQWRNSLRTHAALLLDMPVTKITVDHVVKVLQPIWATRKVGERVRSRIEEVLGVAKAKKLVSENVAVFKDNLGKMLAPKPLKADAKKHPPLSYKKLPGVVAQLKDRKGMGAKALLNAILSGGRTDETLAMQRAELDLDNAAGARWNIPADRMKGHRPHVVMLSTQHADLLRGIAPVEGSTFVFNAPKGGKLSPATLRDVLNGPTKKGGLAISNSEAVPHGFRSTFTNWAGDNRWPVEIAEMAVSHAVVGVRSHYRDQPAEEVLAQLMQEYADHAFGVEKASNVVEIRSAAA